MDEGTELTVSVETFAAGLGEKVLHCRELGHNWRPLTVSWDQKAGAYDRRLRCTSCRTVRKQVLDASGHPLSNGYDYSEGYLAKNVERGQLSRDVFRLEAMTRWLDTDKRKAG